MIQRKNQMNELHNEIEIDDVKQIGLGWGIDQLCHLPQGSLVCFVSLSHVGQLLRSLPLQILNNHQRYTKQT